MQRALSTLPSAGATCGAAVILIQSLCGTYCRQDISKIAPTHEPNLAGKGYPASILACSSSATSADTPWGADGQPKRPSAHGAPAQQQTVSCCQLLEWLALCFLHL